MKLKKKHIIILACVTLIILSLAVFSMKTGNNAVSGAVGTILSPVNKGVAVLMRTTKEFVSDIASSGKNAAENKKLKEEKLALEAQLRMVEGYKTENESLREMLALKENRQDLKTTGANVIGKDSDELSSIITIDKGKKDGVKKNSVVIVPDGLVGVVCEVAHNYSKVKTIFDAESFVAAVCLRSGDMGIVSANSGSGKCSMNYIDKSAKTVVGDMIETSGTGGIFPKGILIGKITEIKEDSRSLTLSATVETSVNINSLDTVLVTIQ